MIPKVIRKHSVEDIQRRLMTKYLYNVLLFKIFKQTVLKNKSGISRSIEQIGNV